MGCVQQAALNAEHNNMDNCCHGIVSTVKFLMQKKALCLWHKGERLGGGKNTGHFYHPPPITKSRGGLKMISTLRHNKNKYCIHVHEWYTHNTCTVWHNDDHTVQILWAGSWLYHHVHGCSVVSYYIICTPYQPVLPLCTHSCLDPCAGPSTSLMPHRLPLSDHRQLQCDHPLPLTLTEGGSGGCDSSSSNCTQK